MYKLPELTIAVLIVTGFTLILPNAEAVSVSISTDKKTYYYGDYLTTTVEVSELVTDVAFLYITDESGKQSSPIPYPISQLKNIQTSPFPFNKETYPQGKYTIDIQYAGSNATTEFYLKDSGKIVIPIWIKDVSKMWTNDLITNEQYASTIKYLIKQNIITIPTNGSTNLGNSTEIPQWVKVNARWWVDGQIEDNDFALGLQHLVKIGVIKVKSSE